MNCPEFYMEDLLRYFDGRPLELELYQTLFHHLEAAFPEAAANVQKTQIRFYNPRLFAAVSLPLRRKKGWPAHSLLVTFGLPEQKRSPRIAAASEPYPNRWTHHVLLSQATEIDGELLGWLAESYAFAAGKRGRR